MIIRSQDKRTIEKFERAGVNSGCSTVYVNGLTFGTYSTEEKAIKVLDMIQEAYLKYEKMGGGVLNQYSSVSPFAIIPPKVFQMPQDSEV